MPNLVVLPQIGSLIKVNQSPRKRKHDEFLSLQVPMIHWDLSTKRILTMEFIEGGQVNDKNYMKEHDINVNEVCL